MKKIISLLFLSILVANIACPALGAGLKILYIGDSVTDGNWGGGGGRPSSGRNQKDMNHIFGSGFMYLCAAHYLGKYPEYEYAFYNRGISGNTVYDLAERWEADVLDINPDVLSVLVGINDIYFYMRGDKTVPFDFEAWEKKYRELLESARQANPKLKIVLGSPFVTPTGKIGEDADFEQYDKMVRCCVTIVKNIASDYNAIYLPFQEMFDQILETTPTSQSTYWVWDGIHPSPAGHSRMAELWIKTIDKSEILIQK